MGYKKSGDNYIYLQKNKDTIAVREEFLEEEQIKKKRSLIGKIYMDRYISKEIIWGTMEKIWQLSKPTSFKESGKNILIVTLAT